MTTTDDLLDLVLVAFEARGAWREADKAERSAQSDLAKAVQRMKSPAERGAARQQAARRAFIGATERHVRAVKELRAAAGARHRAYTALLTWLEIGEAS